MKQIVGFEVGRLVRDVYFICLIALFTLHWMTFCLLYVVVPVFLFGVYAFYLTIIFIVYHFFVSLFATYCGAPLLSGSISFILPTGNQEGPLPLWLPLFLRPSSKSSRHLFVLVFARLLVNT